jgi:hyperosmotically inducible periplasmic protein
MKGIGIVAICFVLTLFSFGQGSSQSSAASNANSNGADAQQGTSALPSSRQSMGGTNPNDRIARETLHELLMLPYYSVFDNLAFRVENGNTVVLLGQVTNPTLKSDAEGSVKRIEGVEKVVNNIETLPPSPADDRIRHAAYRAIYGFDGLSKYSWGAVPSIHIIANRGHLTLTGVVDNENDKNVAGIRAKSVPGAFSVTNNLRVASGGKQTAQK